MSRFCDGISGCLTDCELHTLALMELDPADRVYEDQVWRKKEFLMKSQNWVCRAVSSGVMRDPSHGFEMWVTGLYVAMVSLGGGIGSIMPENLGEYLVFFLLLLLGSVLWAMVIGTICGFTMTGATESVSNVPASVPRECVCTAAGAHAF